MIITRIYDRARAQPAKPATILNGSVISYASFARAIEALRTYFERQNLPAARTVIVLISNPLDAWLFTLALRAIGLDTVAVQTLAEADSLKIKNVACIVSSQQQTAPEAFKSKTFSNTRVVTVPAGIFANIHAGDVPPYKGGNQPFGGNVNYSSGSTGAYKKVLMGISNDAARDEVRAKALGFGEHTIYHAMDFGVWGSFGFKNPSAVWYAGGCVIFDTRPDRLDHFFEHGMNCTHLVPPQLKDLLQSSATPPHKDWELVVTAGFLPRDMAEAAAARLSNNMFISYGSIEMGVPPLRSHIRSAEDLYWLTPQDGRVVQVADEDGRECATDEEGQLRTFISDVDSSSYLDDAEASSKMFRGGFFYPGDMAVRRADGRIRILGRTADLLNVQGAKIPAAPLEQALQRELRVDEVCLFAGLNDDGVDEMVVAIQTNRELSQSELNQAASRLPKFQRVRFSVMKAFPRETGMSKTRRAALRKLVFSNNQ